MQHSQESLRPLARHHGIDLQIRLLRFEHKASAGTFGDVSGSTQSMGMSLDIMLLLKNQLLYLRRPSVSLLRHVA
jgi:hypothetical protein